MPKYFPRIFFYFFEILSQIQGRAQTLGHIVFLQEAPLLRDDPIAHLGPLTAERAHESWQRRIDLILTKNSARIGVAASEVSQNGNRIRIKSEYGIFSATPKKRAKWRLNQRI